MNERLYRSREERMLAGVAGGIAERFDLDPSLVRVLWVVLAFVTGGLFLLLYIAMAVLVPEAPRGAGGWPAWGSPDTPAESALPGWGSTGPASGAAASGPAPGSEAASDTPPPGATPATPSDTPPVTPPLAPPPPPGTRAWSTPQAPGYGPRGHRGGGGAVIAGIVLVMVGAYLLLRAVVPELDLGRFWPLVLIGLGVALVVGSIRPSGGRPVD